MWISEIQIFLWLYNIFLFVLGACLGSFFGVYILRWQQNRSWVQGRSACDFCQKPLPWYVLIPVASFLAYKGNSHCCQKPIPRRYPLLEAYTGIGLVLCMQIHWHANTVVAGVQTGFDIYGTAALLVLFLTGIPISCIDWDSYLIPDEITLPGIVVGLGLSYVNPNIDVWNSLAGVGLAVVGIGGFTTLYGKLRHIETPLGWGDIKYFAMIGSFVGLYALCMIVFMSCCLAMVGTVIIALYKTWRTSRCHTMGSEEPRGAKHVFYASIQEPLPFGPYIYIAAMGYLCML
jgi:leader peptidase (prepilin peptidase) / N-methyltransferase